MCHQQFKVSYSKCTKTQSSLTFRSTQVNYVALFITGLPLWEQYKGIHCHVQYNTCLQPLFQEKLGHLRDLKRSYSFRYTLPSYIHLTKVLHLFKSRDTLNQVCMWRHRTCFITLNSDHICSDTEKHSCKFSFHGEYTAFVRLSGGGSFQILYWYHNVKIPHYK